MNSFVKTVRVLAPFAALSAAGCAHSVDHPGEPHPELPWRQLPLPRSELQVPALLVGEGGIPSAGCFAEASITRGHMADQGIWTFERNMQLDAHLKASFQKFLVDANMASDVARASTQQWRVEVSGLTYDSVDPATVQANFDNETCRDGDLEWFKKDRFVAIEALKAERISVKSESALSDSEKAQLDVAIDKMNAELHTGFNHASNAGGSAEFTAANVYVGVNGTELGAFDCRIEHPLEVPAGTSVPICGGKYQVALSKSAMAGRYALKFTPPRSPTSEFDAPLGSQAMFKVGSLRVLFILAESSGDKFKLQALDVLTVGAKG